MPYIADDRTSARQRLSQDYLVYCRTEALFRIRTYAD